MIWKWLLWQPALLYLLNGQLGLPADREQYIHRLGRTGRKGKEGRGVLLLAPWEDFFLSTVKDLPIAKAPVPSTDPDTKKKVCILMFWQVYEWTYEAKARLWGYRWKGRYPMWRWRTKKQHISRGLVTTIQTRKWGKTSIGWWSLQMNSVEPWGLITLRLFQS